MRGDSILHSECVRENVEPLCFFFFTFDEEKRMKKRTPSYFDQTLLLCSATGVHESALLFSIQSRTILPVNFFSLISSVLWSMPNRKLYYDGEQI